MRLQQPREYVPVDLLQTLAVIIDTGSFTKAGHQLSLTQSAISAQVKRLQQTVGGDVFRKSGGALALTDRGKLINRHARRILEMNEQLLLAASGETPIRPVRIGVPTAFGAHLLPAIFASCAGATGDAPIQMRCASSVELIRCLESGYLDVIMALHQETPAVELLATWAEPFVWMRSPDLLVGPGAPIPYISWPDSLADRLAIAALDRAGIRYVVTFAGEDLNARRAAMQAGVGFVLLPMRSSAETVRPARDRFLPAIEPARAGVSVRDGFDAGHYAHLIRSFIAAVKPADAVEVAVSPPPAPPRARMMLQHM